jgi:hypothetical protein
MFVKPNTVIGWHRREFRLYWKWKSRRGRIGRPGTEREISEVLTAPRSPWQTPYMVTVCKGTSPSTTSGK